MPLLSPVADSLSVTDVLLLVGLAAVALNWVAEVRGWKSSSKLLRAENEDLVRVNHELERDIERLERQNATQAEQIAVLQARVDELSQRDQAAVLARLDAHEINAERRHLDGKSRHQEALSIWTEIRDSLKGASLS